MVRRALAMATGEQYFRLVVQFGLVVVVSRLLTPAEFGVSVIGTGIIAIALGLREFATADFLIQRREVLRDDIRTSFTVLFLVTALISAGVFVLAPWIGSFYGEERLAQFLRVAAVAGLIDALSLPIRGLLRRDMAFGILAFMNTIAATVTAVTTVVLTLAGFSFMSFAWAAVAAASTITVLSFYFRPQVSNLQPTFRSWRNMLVFGVYNGASHVINQTYERLPQLVLGGVLPMSAVGLYNRAAMVSEIPQMVFLTSVFSVSFPALAAEIRKGHGLKEPYLRALGYITVFYWPALVLLALLAYPVVLLLLGHQWLSIVPMLQVMAVASLAWFSVVITPPLLLAVGANRDRVMVHVVGRSVSVIILCSAAYFGVMAMALSQLIIVPYLMLVAFYFVRRHIAIQWREIGAAIWKSAVVSASSAVGPACVAMLSDRGLDLTIPATVVAVLLAVAGWFVGIVATRHPVLLELGNAIEVLSGTPMARRFGRLCDRIVGPSPRAEEVR